MDPSAESNAKLGAEDSGHLRLRSNTETSRYSNTAGQQIIGSSVQDTSSFYQSQNEGSVINAETDPVDTTRRRRRVISFPKVARSSTGFLLNQRHTVNYEDCVTSPFEQEEEEDEDEDPEWVERERVSRQLDEVFSEGADYATITREPTQRRNSRLIFFTTKPEEEDNPWERDEYVSSSTSARSGR
jgi:hypothetical protein